MSFSNKSLFVLAVFLLSIARAGYAQDKNCECAALVQQAIQKIEANYIGFHLLSEEKKKAFAARGAEAIERAGKSAPPGQCIQLMQDLLGYFHDGHLYVLDAPTSSADEVDALKASIRPVEFDADSLIRAASGQNDGTNPLAGLWTDGVSLYAMLANTTTASPYEYVARIVDTEKKEKLGELKLGIRRHGDGWVGDYITNGYAKRWVSVNAMKNASLLSIFGGLLWGRVDSSQLGQRPAKYQNPQAPTVRPLAPDAVLITLPSFLIEKKTLDEVVRSNEAILSSAQYLLVDIRGNIGGNGIYFDLLRYFYDHPAPAERGWAVASADNLAYFEKFSQGWGSDPYQSVVAEMRSHPGKVVKGPDFKALELSPIASKLKGVAILTDRHVKSAAETFILHAKGVSDRVVTIGGATGGVVDFNNINTIKLSCAKLGVQFGYPMYSLTSKVPDIGYNRTGIKPDVEIRDGDLVQSALSVLRKAKP